MLLSREQETHPTPDQVKFMSSRRDYKDYQSWCACPGRKEGLAAMLICQRSSWHQKSGLIKKTRLALQKNDVDEGGRWVPPKTTPFLLLCLVVSIIRLSNSQ